MIARVQDDCLLALTCSSAGHPRGTLAGSPCVGRGRAMASCGHHGDDCQYLSGL